MGGHCTHLSQAAFSTVHMHATQLDSVCSPKARALHPHSRASIHAADRSGKDNTSSVIHPRPPSRWNGAVERPASIVREAQDTKDGEGKKTSPWCNAATGKRSNRIRPAHTHPQSHASTRAPRNRACAQAPPHTSRSLTLCAHTIALSPLAPHDTCGALHEHCHARYHAEENAGTHASAVTRGKSDAVGFDGNSKKIPEIEVPGHEWWRRTLIGCVTTFVGKRGNGGREGKPKERGDAPCGCTSGKSALERAAVEMDVSTSKIITESRDERRGIKEKPSAGGRTGKEREEGPSENQGLARGHRHRHEYIATRRAHLHLPPSMQRRPPVNSLPILNASFAYDSQNPPKGRKERERGKRKDGKPGKSKGREPLSGSRAVPSGSLKPIARNGLIPTEYSFHPHRGGNQTETAKRTLSSTTSSKAEDQNAFSPVGGHTSSRIGDESWTKDSEEAWCTTTVKSRQKWAAEKAEI
ncbi:hypothetical protein B0H13DRAFT_1902810 [Mycena leptocephala]|nr:hypothetical protein B0H13DRAFT_1902810 [Mycena leptocephala]